MAPGLFRWTIMSSKCGHLSGAEVDLPVRPVGDVENGAIVGLADLVLGSQLNGRGDQRGCVRSDRGVELQSQGWLERDHVGVTFCGGQLVGAGAEVVRCVHRSDLQHARGVVLLGIPDGRPRMVVGASEISDGNGDQRQRVDVGGADQRKSRACGQQRGLHAGMGSCSKRIGVSPSEQWHLNLSVTASGRRRARLKARRSSSP
jgi:hypothetical protein